MTRKENVAALRASTEVHYNCAQSVVLPFAEDMGMSREQAFALFQHFGGGMGCGSACGALIGALAVMGGLGLPPEKKEELTRRFREEKGWLDCAPLVKAALERGEERKPHCDGLVRWCVEYVCQETGLE